MKPWRIFLFVVVLAAACSIGYWQGIIHRKVQFQSRSLEASTFPVERPAGMRVLLLVYRQGAGGGALRSVWLVSGQLSGLPRTLYFTPLYPVAPSSATVWQDTSQWQSALRPRDDFQPDEAALGKFIHEYALEPIDAYISLPESRVDDFILTLGGVLAPESQTIGTSLDELLPADLPPQERPAAYQRVIATLCRSYSGAVPGVHQDIQAELQVRVHRWPDAGETFPATLEAFLGSPALECRVSPPPEE